MKKTLALLLFAVLVLGGIAIGWIAQSRPRVIPAITAQARLKELIAHPKAKPDAEPLLAVLHEALVGYRRLIVLFANEKSLQSGEREPIDRIGHAIYYDNQARSAVLEQAMAVVAASPHNTRFSVMDEVLTWIEAGEGLYDADRLAFREDLRALLQGVAQDQSLPAVKLHRRISEDLSALDEIEALYDKELKQIFGRFEERGIAIQRQRWDDYVAKLSALISREQILKDYGIIIPYPPKTGLADDSLEITGKSLPAKTLMLTFDDGPHGTYTEEIAMVLKQYGVPGLFFELGENLGTIGADGQAKPGRLAAVSRKLVEAGYQLGNHSFSHANFAKQDDAALRDEALRTAVLLKAIQGDGSHLFRFPYGAHSRTALGTLEGIHLRSMLWNIDSLDWADPVPNSIADRVFREIDREQRGIVLFHDINARTVRALPGILDRLIADGYRFATWDGTGFKVGEATLPASAKTVPTTGYRDSWALVVGIDEYAKWPKLQYAVRDAEAVRRDLVEKFGFAKDHVFMLKNQEATRAAILNVLNGQLGSSSLQRDDRVFVFFAGHGATRKLSSGRDLGYLVPVDSDPANVATDAIPMTELQNIAEAIPAKHALFIMDSCYSGLGLTRGGPSQNFLRENAKRIGRQMLTAGGADQMVSDGGPGGHSIFTWTLLQGLSGKADLNGDSFITATELVAYIAPAVSCVSKQTPAFGSLPGSEGGEFVFELPAENEFLSPGTKQLESAAIALNQKLDARFEMIKQQGAAKAPAPVMVKTLEGGEAKLVAGKPVAMAPRRSAQRANDRGLQAFREKRYADAEAEFTEALKLRPDFALAANNLGFVYYKQDKFAESVRWFENTLRMDPSRAIAYCNLGDAYAKLGDKEKARKAIQTFLELAPSAPNADYAKGMLKQL
ncbi:MAG: polysaccharide deacetylase family protein [Holophagaceae bacterium]|nr:polysaccharide deacetylase family protein [Holophagaceae bacterium]